MSRPEPRVREIPERHAAQFAQSNKEDLHVWANDIYDALQAGQSAGQVIEKSVEAGWDAEFAKWLVLFTEAQKRPIQLVGFKEISSKAAEVNEKSAKIAFWCAVAIFIGYAIDFTKLKPYPVEFVANVIARIITYPLQAFAEANVVFSSEFKEEERVCAALNLALGVVFFWAAIYSISRLRAIAAAKKDAAASARFKQSGS